MWRSQRCLLSLRNITLQNINGVSDFLLAFRPILDIDHIRSSWKYSSANLSHHGTSSSNSILYFTFESTGCVRHCCCTTVFFTLLCLQTIKHAPTCLPSGSVYLSPIAIDWYQLESIPIPIELGQALTRRRRTRDRTQWWIVTVGSVCASMGKCKDMIEEMSVRRDDGQKELKQLGRANESFRSSKMCTFSFQAQCNNSREVDTCWGTSSRVLEESYEREVGEVQ